MLEHLRVGGRGEVAVVLTAAAVGSSFTGLLLPRLLGASIPALAGLVLLARDGRAAEATAADAHESVDPARKLFDVNATGPAQPADVARAFEFGVLATAAQLVGAGQAMLDMSVEYAKQRSQFGRIIGSYQAIKHKLADLLVDLEHARSTAYHAAWALTDASDDPALAASIAQATCSAAFSRIAADTIQIHGGIGFTWEHQAHLYFKRAATDAALLGSAEQHRDLVAAMVLDTATADGAVRVADGLPV